MTHFSARILYLQEPVKAPHFRSYLCLISPITGCSVTMQPLSWSREFHSAPGQSSCKPNPKNSKKPQLCACKAGAVTELARRQKWEGSACHIQPKLGCLGFGVSLATLRAQQDPQKSLFCICSVCFWRGAERQVWSCSRVWVHLTQNLPCLKMKPNMAQNVGPFLVPWCEIRYKYGTKCWSFIGSWRYKIWFKMGGLIDSWKCKIWYKYDKKCEAFIGSWEYKNMIQIW